MHISEKRSSGHVGDFKSCYSSFPCQVLQSDCMILGKRATCQNNMLKTDIYTRT